MTDKETTPMSEMIVVVDDWIKNISENGKVGEIDTQLLRDVLAEFGADFSEKPGMSELARKYNLGRRPGMDAVWGKARMDGFNDWTKQYVLDYEARTGRPLPVIENKDIKTSGPRQFFGELTALASGYKTLEEYREKTEIRAKKGRQWQERDVNEPIVPTDHSSFPPEFPVDAWEFIKTLKQ